MGGEPALEIHCDGGGDFHGMYGRTGWAQCFGQLEVTLGQMQELSGFGWELLGTSGNTWIWRSVLDAGPSGNVDFEGTPLHWARTTTRIIVRPEDLAPGADPTQWPDYYYNSPGEQEWANAAPAPDVQLSPALDPLLSPVVGPSYGRPLPRRARYQLAPFNPLRPPGERTEVGGENPLDPFPSAVKAPRIRANRPKQKRDRIPRYRLRKPGKKTSEKKIQLRTSQGLPAAIIGGVTEFDDWMDALFYALPKQVRLREFREGGHYLGRYGSSLRSGEFLPAGWNFPWLGLDEDRDRLDRYGRPYIGYLDPYDKFLIVRRYWSMVDWQRAVKNILFMEITDSGIGLISQKTNKALLRDGRVPHGLFIGPAL